MRTCFPCYDSPSKISSFIRQENTDAPELRMERRGKINEELIKEPSVSCCAPARDSGGAGNGTPARPSPGAPQRQSASGCTLALISAATLRAGPPGGSLWLEQRAVISSLWEPPSLTARHPPCVSGAPSPGFWKQHLWRERVAQLQI